MEEHEQVLKLERRRLSEMQLAAKLLDRHCTFYGYSIDEQMLAEGLSLILVGKRHIIFVRVFFHRSRLTRIVQS